MLVGWSCGNSWRLGAKLGDAPAGGVLGAEPIEVETIGLERSVTAGKCAGPVGIDERVGVDV